MLFPIKKLEDHIIWVLKKEPVSGPELLKLINKKKTISKESFYRILRKLLKDEVLVKNKTTYNLSTRWLEKISELNELSKPKINLMDGDQIIYTFKNAESMYNYWAYLFDSLFESNSENTPVLLYHSYEWFIYGRKDAEKLFLEKFTKNKKLALLAIGDNSTLSKKFKKEWASKYLQINTGITYKNKNTLYINVLGDYIFKVFTSKQFASDVENFFLQHQNLTSENFEELLKITNRKDRTKLVLKKSKKEALEWLHKYKKDFIA